MHPIRHVRAVVLSWNGGDLTTRCVERLLATDWPPSQLEVVVVDNASTDGTPARLVERFGDRIRLIGNDRNAGFPANNLAMADLTGTDAVALINNDAEVDPGWLRPLAAALEGDERLGAACPLLVFAPRYVDVTVSSTTFAPGAGDPRTLGVMVSGVEVGGVDRWDDLLVGEGVHDLEHGARGPFRWTGGEAVLRLPVPEAAGVGGAVTARLRLAAVGSAEVRVAGVETVRATVASEPTWVEVALDPAAGRDVVQNAGSVVFADGSGADRCFGEPVGLNVAAATDVFAWCGGAVLLRSRHLEEVGLFHEPYFLYYEDVDLSWRGQARGWRFRFVPGSVVRHHHAASTGTSSATFGHFNERNRLLLLVRNAPAPLAWREVRRYVADTAEIAWREISGPLRRRRPPRPVMTWRRLRALASLLRLLPAELPERRRLRRAQTVPDPQLLGRLVPRSPGAAS